MNLLFVCTGNTCRSSMAQLLAHKILLDLGQAAQVRLKSAGVMAWPGQGASPKAVTVLQEQELDLSSHRATQLTEQLVQEADAIVTMTESHREQVVRLQPSAEDKIYVLHVSDPFGGSEELYRQCAQEIEERLGELLPQLLEKYQKFI